MTEQPLSKNSCANCAHVMQTDRPGQYMCRRYPPQAHMFMTQGISGPQPAFLSNFPGVNSEMICGEFKSNLFLHVAK